MRILDTPWGPVEVPGIVPDHIQCGQCGRCCQGFVLSMRETDKENWYRQFLKKMHYQYPKDIGAIYNLMEKIPDTFSVDGQQVHRCKAFNPETKRCDIFEAAPEIRPIACWAFPYNYDFAGLMNFPYIGCTVFLKTIAWLLDRYPEAIAGVYHPFHDNQ